MGSLSLTNSLSFESNRDADWKLSVVSGPRNHYPIGLDPD